MKTRIIAGAALVLVLAGCIFGLPRICTALLVGAMGAVAAYELLFATGMVKHIRLVGYAAVSAVCMSLWSWGGQNQALGTLLVLAVFSVYFVEMMSAHLRLTFDKVAMCIAAALLIPYLLTSLVRILSMPLGRFYIAIPFIMAFLPDTGAYFVGRTFGKHPLAPVISPKKTMEGMVGGALSGMLGMVIYALILDFGFQMEVNYLFAAIYGVAAAAGSVFGDLSFSVIKRQTGIKDYGHLIPGHGGILDRFDSMMVVGPLAEVLVLLLPIVVN